MGCEVTEQCERSWTAEAAAAVARFHPVSSMKNRVLAHIVAKASEAWMRGLNRVSIIGVEQLDDARQHGKGVLTFSNHVSLFDDPLLTSCLSRSEWSQLRWITADALNFYGTSLKAAVFNAGKCVPIVRGAGVQQPGMAFLVERLRIGDWVHIFPEGGRSRRADQSLQLPLKTGFAELVRASSPIVVPFHHQGMGALLPIGGRLPRVAKRITVRFGEAVASDAGLARRPIEAITAWAADQLLALQAAAVQGERS